MNNNALSALTFLNDTHVFCFVAVGTSVEIWTADLERLGPEGTAVVTHVFQFEFPSNWMRPIWPGVCGAEVALPPATHGLAEGNFYFEDDDWASFNKRVPVVEFDNRVHDLHVPFTVLKSFSDCIHAQSPAIIPYSAWSDAKTLAETNIPRYPEATHLRKAHGSRVFWSARDGSAMHVVDLHPRRVAWMQKSPSPRFRERIFNIPAPLDPIRELSCNISADCLVVQEVCSYQG